MNKLRGNSTAFLVALFIAIAAASCSSAGTTNATPTLESATDTTPSADPVDSSTSTSSSTTTTATTSTTATTAEPEPTESTPTEDDLSDLANRQRPELEIPTEWESELDEIYGRYLLYWEALDAAYGPPFADPDYPPLLDLLDPNMKPDIQRQLQRAKDANEVVIRQPDSLDDHGLRLPNPAPLGKVEGNRVVIQDCWIQDETVVTLDGSSSTEYFTTVLHNVDMIVLDGQWKVFGVTEADERSDGYQECQDLFDTLPQR